MTKKLYKAEVNASGGFTRVWGVMAESKEEALKLFNGGKSTHFFDDLLALDCQDEDMILFDDIEEGDEADFENSHKEAPQSTWDTLREFKEGADCPECIRKVLNTIEYL